jgi:hypothetical protein
MHMPLPQKISILTKNIYLSSKNLSCLRQGDYMYIWFRLHQVGGYLPNLASAPPAYDIAAKNLHIDEETVNKLKKAFLVYDKEATGIFGSHFIWLVDTLPIELPHSPLMPLPQKISSLTKTFI